MKFTKKNIYRSSLLLSSALMVCAVAEYKSLSESNYLASDKTVAGIRLENTVMKTDFSKESDTSVNTDINDEETQTVTLESSDYLATSYENIDVASYDINMNTATAKSNVLGYVPVTADTDSSVFDNISGDEVKVSDTTSSKKKSSNVLDDIDSYIDYSKFTDIGIADVDSYLNVRKEAGTDSEIIGKMPPKAGCTILDIKDGWAHIKSGDVKGYVKTDYLLTGMDAIDAVKRCGRLVIVVDCDALRVREGKSTNSKILTSIMNGEELEVISSDKKWVKVEINNYKGYVSRDYVSFSFKLLEASKIELPSQDDTSNIGNNDGTTSVSSGYSSTGSAVVSTASKYLGNRYVYGGNSLTNGIDCSGFTQQIFAMYGYSLPRTSRSQANCGTTISASDARAGDLVFYGSSSGISHVAICMGNGKIIHASNPRSGIKISNMYYTTPAKVVRIIN